MKRLPTRLRTNLDEIVTSSTLGFSNQRGYETYKEYIMTDSL